MNRLILTLGLSAALSAPWHRLALPLIAISGLGVAGCAYVISVIRAAKRQREYTPVLEDKVFHWWLPFAAYACLAICPAGRAHVDQLLFAIGFVALTLMFAGIHNAWDAAVYILAAHRLFPERESYAPIDAEMLQQYGVFGRIGAFGVDLNSARGAGTSARLM